MNDTQLTEKAIEELMREMGEIEKTRNGPQERKKNPLGRPTFHRRFLKRTVYSVMQHNRREIERRQTSSRRMLREMDNRDRRRAKNGFFNGECFKNDEHSLRYKATKRKSRNCARNNHSSHSRGSSSSSSSSNISNSRSNHKKRKKKDKKHLSKKTKRGKRSISISSSSTMEDRSKSQSSSTNRNQCEKNFEVVEYGYVNGTLPLGASYMQTNSFALAAMALAYGHIQEVINSTNSHIATVTSKDLLQNDKLSDTSFDASLIKELALTDNDDSDDNDANDEQRDESDVLTFDLSTSDEDEKVITDQNKRSTSTNRKAADCDSDSSVSCISVDSVNDEDIGNSNEVTKKSTVKSMESIDVAQVLTSSDSEGETVEIISVHQVKNHQVTVDLTDD